MQVHAGEVLPAEREDLDVALVDDGHRCGEGRRFGKRPHAEVAVEDLAPGIVALDGEAAPSEAIHLRGACRERAGRLDPAHDQRAVHPDLDPRLLDGDVEREPLVVLGHRLVDVPDAVQAAGHLVLEVTVVLLLGVVDLDLESLGRPVLLLVRRVEVEARVGAGASPDLDLGLEVLERGLAVRSHVEEVGPRTVAGDRPVHDAEGGRVLGGPPSGQRLSVEEGHPTLVGGAGAG